MNLGALLRKRMHFVETRRLWVDLKRGGRETKKDSYSSKQVKKSPDSCEVWDQHSFGVVGSGEPHRTRQHFVASAGLECAAARSLPAVCTLARLQSTGSPVRETQWALLSRERDRETRRYRERVSEGVDKSRGQDWWRDGNLDGGNQGWVGTRRFMEWFWGLLLGSIKPSGLEKGLEWKGRSLEGKGNTNKWMGPEMSSVWGGERICRSLERQIWDLVTLQFMCAC